MDQTQRISRERRKELKKRLMEQMGSSKQAVYRIAVLSWFQFLTRIVAFALVAYLIQLLALGQPIQLPHFLLALLALSFLGLAFSCLARRDQGRASFTARNAIKRQFFAAFQAREGKLGHGERRADVLTLAAQGIDSLDTFYQLYLNSKYRSFLNCGTVLVIVSLLFPLGGLTFLLCLPLIPLSILLVQKRSQKIMDAYWASYLDVGRQFMDHLRGLNTLYHYGADERYEADFVSKAEQFRQSTMTLLRFQLQSVGYMDFVMYFGIAVSGFLALQAFGAGDLSLFAMICFVLIASEFFTPIRELGYTMHLLMMNLKMADRLFGFLEASPTTTTSEQHECVSQSPVESIRLSNLNLDYGEGEVLKALSLTLEKGKLYALSGESGSGKTSLFRLLSGDLPAEEGSLLINGEGRAEGLDSRALSLAPDAYLFNRSILDNLKLATQMSDEAIERFLEERGLLRFAQKFPEGLQTVVGEGGSFLSPGQRQQVAFVRAFLAEKSIYLLDEMSASIDAENEAELFDLLKQMSEKAIVVYSAHRMRLLDRADQVLFLEKGGNWTLGTPQALYQNHATYRQFYDLQAGGSDEV